MLSAILGLVSAFILGSADFLGGVASRGMSALRITAIVAVSGLVPLLILTAFTDPVWSWQAVLFGGISGVTGAVAISLLYACLAVGPMSILSPLTAVVGAVVPMSVGLLKGHQLALIGYLGLGSALIAVVLVGFVPEKGAVRASPKAMAMATASGILIGVFLILIDLTPDDSGLVPLVMNRAVNAAIMGTVIAIVALTVRSRKTRLNGRLRSDQAGSFQAGSFQPTTPTSIAAAASAVLPATWWRGPIGIAIAAGFVDAIANIVLLVGLRLGELTVISVLSAMYPAGTIILAAVVLRERIAPVQVVGLVLAIAAAGMLAIA